MADAKEEAYVAKSLEDKVADLPAMKPSPAAVHAPPRLFGRTRSIHELLGSGTVADILLWRKKYWSAVVLVGSTLFYVLFEWAGYTFLSLVSSTLLFLLMILFVWSNVASLFNRPPPPIPSMRVSEETVYKAATKISSQINWILAILHDVSLGRDFKVFLKVEAALYLLSIIGGWCNLLTLVYIGVLVALTLPALYDKYEDEIEKYTHRVVHEMERYYKKVHDLVVSKIPRAQSKTKKVE